jgi:GAF domain-containing protein
VQRLARSAARLAAAEDPEGVVREALAAALDLSGYESALVALADGHGALYPHLAEGPFAVVFSQLAAEELAAMAAWVDEGTSSYTVGDSTGRGFAGHEVLRRAGAGALAVLPLVGAGERLGLIVVADRANRRPEVEDVELLELLALQAANGLRLATLLGARPARDALTGLHAALPPLSPRGAVLLVDVGSGGDDGLRAAAGLLRELTPSGGQAARIGADEFVVTLDARHAGAAETIGGELRSRLGGAVDVGIAFAEPGESGEAVVQRLRLARPA